MALKQSATPEQLSQGPSNLEVGQRILELRNAMGISQYRLAQLTGMTTTTLRFLEQGKRHGQIRSLARIARALGMSLKEFIPKDW